MKRLEEQEFSIVAVDKFIQATRDSGYKGTSSAVAELVDNSLQAGATEITVSLTANLEEEYPIVVTVVDNGSGMDSRTLRTALRFGGSTRCRLAWARSRCATSMTMLPRYRPHGSSTAA